MKNNSYLILTGSDPSMGDGGVAFAVQGYINALNECNILNEYIVTYRSDSKNRKWKTFIFALPRLISSIKIAKNQGKNVIVYSHTAKGLSLLRQGIVLFIARRNGAKTLLQLHSIRTDDYLTSRFKLLIFRTLLLSQADQVCVLTKWWKKRFEDSGIERVAVISNPLPRAWEQRARKVFTLRPKKKFSILTLTRLEAGKGVDLVLESMQFLPANIKLVVAGNGDQLDLLIEKANLLGISEKVEFTGWVSGKRKQQLFNRADIFCLPTMYDSFGMVFLEAMSYGIPVIALNWGPIKDIIMHNYTGFLVSKPEGQLIAHAIEKMMHQEVRERMGKQAQQWVLNQFAAKIIGRNLQDIIHTLTSASA